MARRKSSEMLMKPPSEKSAGRRPSRPTFRPLDAHEIELTDFFVRMAAIIGVPRSVAEIYALLYASPEALDFGHIQGRLGISKGSVSQGLKFLRDHEMILALKAPGSRRERWQPTPSLAASLVALLRSQVLPTLERAQPSLQRILAAAQARGDQPEVIERLTRLNRWNNRALELAPLLLPPPGA
jgi:DNA-binding transcriptional regulator GbsR (MarR family)